MCDKRNQFCFVCGKFVDKSHRIALAKNQAIVEAFNIVFNRSYVGSRWYEPEYACSACSTTLKKFKKHGGKRLPFSSPMDWHRQIFHRVEDCYFCQTDTLGHHYKTRSLIKYANVSTVSKPVPSEREVEPCASNELDIGTEFEDKELGAESEVKDVNEGNDKPYLPLATSSAERHLVTDVDFQDLVRDLGLSTRQTEVLGSRLRQWNLVESDFRSTFVRHKDLSHIEELFKIDSVDNNLVYCVDIDELFLCLNQNHHPEDWRLFLDGSSKSLKVVLLHNANQLPSVPIAYATDMKETYATMQKILHSISYYKYQWQIVSDLKVLTILLGMQGGYTKHPCYFCEWDSRDENHHYKRRDWQQRKSFQLGRKNVLNIPLVQADNIILPPLHLKLGYMKQFVKKLDKNGKAFQYLRSIFPRLSEAKVKGGIFVGPQIRKVMGDQKFLNVLNGVEKRAWLSFVSLCKNFLGNHRSANYVEVVDEFLDAYEEMGCRMSIKVHFLHSHLDFFPENLGQFSDEQGERFHQEISAIEKRFEGKNSIRMISNYCWSLRRETPDSMYKRSRLSKHF